MPYVSALVKPFLTLLAIGFAWASPGRVIQVIYWEDHRRPDRRSYSNRQ